MPRGARGPGAPLDDAVRHDRADILKNDDGGLDALRLHGEQGDLWAQFTLGEMYRKGEGVAQCSAEAAKWYRMAADRMYCPADYFLGLMYLKGEGVPEDHAEAFKHFYAASTGGHKGAQQSLGRMYENGQGVPKDMERAWWWLGSSAEPETDQSDPMYYHGQMDVKGKRSCTAAEADFSAGGGLFLMTGPVDDRTCPDCLDQLSLVRTAEEWETIAPAIFTAGIHEGCRCSWRRVRSVDRWLQDIQHAIWLQMDVQKFKRGIYWKPIMFLGGDFLKGLK